MTNQKAFPYIIKGEWRCVRRGKGVVLGKEGGCVKNGMEFDQKTREVW